MAGSVSWSMAMPRLRCTVSPAGFPAPPKGFGLGNLMAGSILKRADMNKDDKLTAEEFVAAAEALFKEADKEMKGTLDEAGVGAALNLLTARPAVGPGFGPPMKEDEKKKEEP